METLILSEQIDPRILEALFANFPTAETAMLELTDNAIGDRIPGKKMILTLRLRKDLVRVVNKGGQGMDLNRLCDFFTWGKSEARGVFRFFGQGGKAAMGYLGERWRILSFPLGSKVTYRIVEDGSWTNRADGLLKKYKVVEETVTQDDATVQIDILGVKRRVSPSRLKRVLAATYAPLIKSGELEVHLNDVTIPATELPCKERQEFREMTNYGPVWGWLGLKSTDEVRGGVRCYSQGRLIRERGFFDFEPLSHNLDKLIGEVHVDFVPVLPNKTDYDRGSPTWEVVCRALSPRVKPWADRLQMEPEVPASLKKLERDIEALVNEVLKKDVEGSLVTEGRKAPQPGVETLATRSKEQEEMKRPATTAPVGAIGILPRLGTLKVYLKAFDPGMRCHYLPDKREAYINTQFPVAKMMKGKAFPIYCVESVALEYFKTISVSIEQLIDKVNQALASKKLSA